MAIDYTTPLGQVRLLVCDVDDTNQAGGLVFSDDQINAFLSLADQNVKRAAALAIDTNAGNEALASKVITSQDVATQGDRLATAMHALAQSLREQADVDEAGEGYFDIVDTVPDCWPPELSGW